MSVAQISIAQIWSGQVLSGIAALVLLVCVLNYALPLFVRRRQVQRWRGIEGRLALTYDDGPDEVTTVAVLELLEELGVEATFYLVGFRGEQCSEILDRLGSSNHELATHTHWHKNAWKKPPWFEYRDSMRAYKTLSGCVGWRDPYRPPFGKTTGATLLGMWLKGRRVHWWTVAANDTLDTFEPPSLVAQRMLDRGETVVLMHCHHRDERRRGYVLELTRELVGQARARGIEFVKMCELEESRV